jgi:heme/copper-type cytochrome/quinol oxidase subunit 4
MTTHRNGSNGAGGHAASGMSGFIVFVVLAVMTVVEYAIATQMDNPMVLLVVIAIAKAALILWYFMHVARAWLAGRSH